MGQPKSKPASEPNPFSTGKTLFFTEGDQAALLVLRMGPVFRKRAVAVDSPAGALAWCLDHGAGLVFTRTPINPRRN